jgi:hypothetical protein
MGDAKMRSLIVKAALAALLISTPLTAAFAAAGRDHTAPGHERGEPANRFGGDHAPAPSTYAPNGQLDAILADLGDTNARITYDRSHGLITPAQARRLRVEEATIRREAVADNRRDSGMMPMGQYEQLMAQVSQLQRQL